jgi:hypothetical protein
MRSDTRLHPTAAVEPTLTRLTRRWPMEKSAALALYEKVVAAMAGVERKGDTMPYTSLDGHMFSVLHKDGTVALRLPATEREAFLNEYKTTLSSQYGSVQPEYVVVPDSLLRRTKELQRFFEISRAYVASLKPKPTTKKKAASSSSTNAAGPRGRTRSR